MHRLRTPSLALATCLAGLVVLSCSSGSEDDLSGTAVPSFALTDVNPNSPTSGRTVLVRDFLGSVSAWYFGHST
jgi:hypothetical protein